MTGKFAQRWLRGSFLHSSIAKCWIKDVLWQENLHLATKSQVLQPAGLLPPQIWRAWLDFVEGKFWERWIWIGRSVRFCLQTNPTVLAKMLAMWKVGGIKIAWNFFLQTHKEISEKRNFFVNPSVTENFQREHFSGRVLSEIPQTQVSEYLYKRGVFWPPEAELQKRADHADQSVLFFSGRC